MQSAARHLIDRSTAPPLQVEQADVLLFDNSIEGVYARFHRRVRAFARNRCQRQWGTWVDVDDIVQTVFGALVQSNLLSKYQLRDENTIWKVLSVMTLNELRSQGKYHRAKKRDVRTTRSLTTLRHLDVTHRDDPAELVVTDILQTLPETDRAVALQRLDGYEVAEIAERLNLAKRTVERSLQHTRTVLNRALHS